MKHIKVVLSSVMLVYVLFGCTSEVDYETMVRQGLNSGIQQDSLFLGYHFGMNIEEFHSSSWEMNRQGIITGQTKVIYKLDALNYEANMEFYPTFHEGEIVRIPVNIAYVGWAPWNEHLWPDKLIPDLIEYFEDEYGAKFTYVYVPQIDQHAYVSIQGNREIRLYQISQSTVMADFIDLSVYKKNVSPNS